MCYKVLVLSYTPCLTWTVAVDYQLFPLLGAGTNYGQATFILRACVFSKGKFLYLDPVSHFIFKKVLRNANAARATS